MGNRWEKTGFTIPASHKLKVQTKSVWIFSLWGAQNWVCVPLPSPSPLFSRTHRDTRNLLKADEGGIATYVYIFPGTDWGLSGCELANKWGVFLSFFWREEKQASFLKGIWSLAKWKMKGIGLVAVFFLVFFLRKWWTTYLVYGLVGRRWLLEERRVKFWRERGIR